MEIGNYRQEALPSQLKLQALVSLLLVSPLLAQSTPGAALPGAVVDLLPSGSGQPLPAAPSAQLPAAGVTPATAYPQVQAVPVTKAPKGSGCIAEFATGQQCGGNLSNAILSCSDFDSCANTAWSGGCCPASSSCAQLQNSGPYCWSCGGSYPKTLTAASQDVSTRSPNMCTQQSANGDFDYGCVLGASMLFYDAQRSGKLPADVAGRVPWRGDSALRDRAPNGASLVGGWYDAGDLNRFTFPAAFTVATLALGFLEFENAFDQAGQTDYMLSNLRWAADWLSAARYQPDGFVAVTWLPGDSISASHNFWGKPEEVPGQSQVRALEGPSPGADLLGQGAAALAAVSQVFKDRDPVYSQELLDVAQGLFDQAMDGASAGLYSNTIPEVKAYYTSFSYMDDKAWAAAWLALRTQDPDMLSQAKDLYAQHMEEEGGGEGRRFDYNNVIQGAAFLLAKQDPSTKDDYAKNIKDVMSLWLNGRSNITYTAKGMAFIDGFGNLRYVANQAFMGLLYSTLYPDDKDRKLPYSCFARKQARIMLGETGSSYVVGVGNNPPCRPHHRAASCPAKPNPRQPCDCTALYNPGCSPNTLYGGLVSGPGPDDDATEATRWNFQQSEMALDWNAGFTGMLAGLVASDVSWEQCKAAGLADGRARSAAGEAGRGWGLWLLLMAAGLLQLAFWLAQ